MSRGPPRPVPAGRTSSSLVCGAARQCCRLAVDDGSGCDGLRGLPLVEPAAGAGAWGSNARVSAACGVGGAAVLECVRPQYTSILLYPLQPPTTPACNSRSVSAAPNDTAARIVSGSRLRTVPQHTHVGTATDLSTTSSSASVSAASSKASISRWHAGIASDGGDALAAESLFGSSGRQRFVQLDWRSQRLVPSP